MEQVYDLPNMHAAAYIPMRIIYKHTRAGLAVALQHNLHSAEAYAMSQSPV